MEITRTYTKRDFGRIGEITLAAPDGDWMINGNVLPESSVIHLVNFAGQTLQDAYAGAKTLEDAVAAFGTKLTRLLEGKIGLRSSDGVDEFTATARNIVEAFLRVKWGKESAEWKAHEKDVNANDKLDAIYAKNEKVFKPQVETKIANAQAERERKAELKMMNVDITI